MKSTNMKNNYNSLFWKISGVFFILITIIGITYTYLSIDFSSKYLDEIDQRLNRDTAKNIVENSDPFYDGKVIQPKLKEMFHHVMAINPNLEVYLVDPKGKIIAWYPENKQIKINRVDLKPILYFINDKNKEYIKGDDPLNPNIKKVFSASPLTMNNMLYAYIYVVLNSEQNQVASASAFNSYFLEISARTMAITLLFALIIGLIIIRIITRNYSKIVTVMEKFKKGDLQARVVCKSMGDEQRLGAMFNEMADILTDNIDKLKEVENLRRELIANVSHDLRTPIAIIRGYIETLQMKEDFITPEERKTYTNTVRDSAEKLERLVNELFDLSKLEANQVVAKKEAFIVSELVSDISNKYKLVAESKNIVIEASLSKELSPVFADISLIERVLQNLIDNALKFTPSGGKIEIKTEKRNNNTIAISVTDNGIGIPEDEREQIFSRYYKANNFTAFQNSTGLGLAIAKKILDLHHSTLELTSKEKSGSSFLFTLQCQ
jgi:signal transduction histidine kinase